MDNCDPASEALPSRAEELLKVPDSLLQQLSFLCIPPPCVGTSSSCVERRDTLVLGVVGRV